MDHEEYKKIKQRMYQECFQTDCGRRVLDDLIRTVGLFRSSVDQSRPNALETFYREGEKTIVFYILKLAGFLGDSVQKIGDLHGNDESKS